MNTIWRRCAVLVILAPPTNTTIYLLTYLVCKTNSRLAYSEHTPTVAVAPTGGGKSAMGPNVDAPFPGKRTTVGGQR